MDPGPIFSIDTTKPHSVYFLQLLFFILLQTLSFHTIQLILCFQQTGEIDTLTESLGQSTLVVLCAGSTLLLTPVVRPATSQLATPSEATPFSYWSIKPWFLTEGKLAAVLIIPSSWGSQQIAIGEHQALFLAPLPGRRSTSARGVSHSQFFA